MRNRVLLVGLVCAAACSEAVSTPGDASRLDAGPPSDAATSSTDAVVSPPPDRGGGSIPGDVAVVLDTPVVPADALNGCRSDDDCPGEALCGFSVPGCGEAARGECVDIAAIEVGAQVVIETCNNACEVGDTGYIGRPFARIGAGACEGRFGIQNGAFNCDPRNVTCKQAPNPDCDPADSLGIGAVPVDGACWSSFYECVPLALCRCTNNSDCPATGGKEPDALRCDTTRGRCELVLE